jgi:hypothetical protein
MQQPALSWSCSCFSSTNRCAVRKKRERRTRRRREIDR